MRRWLRIFLLGIVVLTPLSAWAARQTNGTTQYLNSASALTLATTKITVAFWLYWDAFANDSDMAMSYPHSTSFTAGFVIQPNQSSGVYEISELNNAPNAFNVGRITRPSAATWHHYVFCMDRTTGAVQSLTCAYIDGSSVAVTDGTVSSLASSNLGSHTLTLMAEDAAGTPANFGAGRIAEVAIYSGYLFTGTDATNLYNSGNGALATSVQGGSLAYYWQLCGTASPETATTGSINMTVTGATAVAHPISTCGTARPRRVIQQ